RVSTWAQGAMPTSCNGPRPRVRRTAGSRRAGDREGDVEPVELIILMAVAVGAAGAARKLGLSAPLALVVLGLGLSLLPFVPNEPLDPEVVLLLVLPPLLYSAALESSYVGIRANVRPIALLSIGLVLFTTVVVGQTVAWLVPGMPLPVAYALGA